MPKLYDRASVPRKPDWLKIRLHREAGDFAEVKQIVKEHRLHTICTSGK